MFSDMNTPSNHDLLAKIRRLSQIAFPHWFRSNSTPVPEPRPFDPNAKGGPELSAILNLEGRRTIALSRSRLGEAELLEARQRERMTALVARKPAELDACIEWLSDVARAADLLGKRKTLYARDVKAERMHDVAALADQLFLHVLPYLMERESADFAALEARVGQCRPDIRAMTTLPGGVPCPIGERPVSLPLEAKLAKQRARWNARAAASGKQRGPRGPYGQREGSLNSARLELRRRAEAAPAHLEALLAAKYPSKN
ncbi:MAG: hypothetical protein JSS20_19585 [Proteobacteria bacterium]|nr:hypothetical protein [Pseudomonadota bacterium]